MYAHGPQIDVTDLELSPIVGMWSDIFYISNRFREFVLFKTLDSKKFVVTLSYAQSCPISIDDECAEFPLDPCG